MAVEDIRVKLSFKGNRKRRKLRKLLGPSYLDHLIDIWLTVAEERPTGELLGWDDEDLVAAASATVPYKGNINALKDALLESGFAEKNGAKNIKIHNWEKHQEWVIKSPDRSIKAKHAVIVREIRKLYCKDCPGHYNDDISEIISKMNQEIISEMCPLIISEMCPFRSRRSSTGSSTGSSPIPFLNPSYTLPSPYLLPTNSLRNNTTPCSPPSIKGGRGKSKVGGNGKGKNAELSGRELIERYRPDILDSLEDEIEV